jgi:hypothetical protein
VKRTRLPEKASNDAVSFAVISSGALALSRKSSFHTLQRSRRVYSFFFLVFPQEPSCLHNFFTSGQYFPVASIGAFAHSASHQ